MNYFEINNRASNSLLTWLEVSPQYLLSRLTDREEPTPSMKFGSLLHNYVEDPDSFRIVPDVRRPSDNMVKLVHEYVQCDGEEASRFDEAFKKSDYSDKARGRALKDFKSRDVQNYLKYKLEQQEKDETTGHVLTWAEMNKLKRCVEALEAHPLAAKLLGLVRGSADSDVANEDIILWDYTLPDGRTVPCKGMLDRRELTSDKLIITDLKTTSESCFGKLFHINDTGYTPIDYYGTGFMRSYLNYRYYRQRFMYTKGAADQYGISEDDIEFNFVAINTQLYEVAVYSGTGLSESVAEETENLLGQYYDLLLDESFQGYTPSVEKLIV